MRTLTSKLNLTLFVATSKFDKLNAVSFSCSAQWLLFILFVVHQAVNAAENAFYNGEWGKMSARDRGALLFKLADLMEQHKEELATIEAIDSGAVYTLALKTHVGMSIDTWRFATYFQLLYLFDMRERCQLLK